MGSLSIRILSLYRGDCADVEVMLVVYACPAFLCDIHLGHSLGASKAHAETAHGFSLHKLRTPETEKPNGCLLRSNPAVAYQICLK